MAFAPGLKRSLRTRQGQVPAELCNGDSLECVLNGHLTIVEEMADRELLTAILLLDGADQRLRYGAAPSLPAAYCRAIDGGVPIGPCAGSCGTAAYLRQAVYVPDIATDPLWAKYRDLALAHDLRACWSTPIRGADDAVIGTFAIFARSVGSPTSDEIEALEMIAEHVAQAIMWARDSGDLKGPTTEDQITAALRLVNEGGVQYPSSQWRESLLESVATLEAHVDYLEQCAAMTESTGAAEALRAAVIKCRRVISVIRAKLEADDLPESYH